MDYSARVPRASGTTCQPVPTPVHGTVDEQAVVRAGYLITVQLRIIVPPQTLANGTEAAHGIEGEILHMVQIGGKATRTIS